MKLLSTLCFLLSALPLAAQPFADVTLAQPLEVASAPACDTSNDSEQLNHVVGSSVDPISGSVWVAQMFSFAGNRTLTGIFFQMSDTGSDVGNVVLSLYTDDGGGKPSAEISGTSVSVATSTFSISTAVWFQFSSPYSYTASQNIHIVCRTSGGGTANTFYTTGTLYTGGTVTYSSNSGSTWAAPTTSYDYNFSIWGCE